MNEQPERPTSELSETRTDRRRRRTHRAILDAGVDVIAEYGLAKLTISSITEAADVALGSFYNHFEDREHYLRTLFIEATMDWLDEVREIRTEPFKSEAERFAGMILMLVRKTEERPAWGRFLSESLSSTEITKGSELAMLIMPRIERGDLAGVFAVANPELAAGLVIGFIRRALMHIEDAGMFPGLDRVLAGMMLRTLGTPEVAVDDVITSAAATLGLD